jgi:hypothetical protein
MTAARSAIGGLSQSSPAQLQLAQVSTHRCLLCLNLAALSVEADHYETLAICRTLALARAGL